MQPPRVIAESAAARDPSTPPHFAVLEACAAWHVAHGTSPDAVTVLATVVDTPDGWVVAEIGRAEVAGLGDGALEVLARLTGAPEADTVPVPTAALRGLLAELLDAKPGLAELSPATAEAAWGLRVAALVTAVRGYLDTHPAPAVNRDAYEALARALRPFGA